MADSPSTWTPVDFRPRKRGTGSYVPKAGVGGHAAHEGQSTGGSSGHEPPHSPCSSPAGERPRRRRRLTPAEVRALSRRGSGRMTSGVDD